jgi:hypothetical protein
MGYFLDGWCMYSRYITTSAQAGIVNIPYGANVYRTFFSCAIFFFSMAQMEVTMATKPKRQDWIPETDDSRIVLSKLVI